MAFDWLDVPVTLPPGCARLLTIPSDIGSETPTITIGVVDAACFAAIVDADAIATMTSGRLPTISLARVGRREKLPSAERRSRARRR